MACAPDSARALEEGADGALLSLGGGPGHPLGILGFELLPPAAAQSPTPLYCLSAGFERDLTWPFSFLSEGHTKQTLVKVTNTLHAAKSIGLFFRLVLFD